MKVSHSLMVPPLLSSLLLLVYGRAPFREEKNELASRYDDRLLEKRFIGVDDLTNLVFGKGCNVKPVKDPWIRCPSDYSRRWYYDEEDQECKKYSWLGCGTNTNTFDEEEKCIKNCVDKCLLPKNTDKCDASKAPKKSWYFHKSSQTCKQFDSYGCKGHQNVFKSEKDCLSDCKKFLPAGPTKGSWFG